MMKLYDVKCPICGTVNHNLYLEETNGWMECECCQQMVKVQPFAEEQKVPSFKPRQLAAYFAAAN
jgi:transcription initiation factor TFIIIB Brf1 subunit/transcription initiation factor TFIIB